MIPPIARASIPQRPLMFAGITRSSLVQDTSSEHYVQLDHSSWLFRDPAIAQYFPTILRHMFPTGCDVKVYGSSDGSEVYSLIMMMNQAFAADANAKKRYTITGYDISSERVRLAQQGVIGITQAERNGFASVMKAPLEEFFTPLPASSDVPDAGQNDLMEMPCQDPRIRHLTSRDFAQQFFTFHQVKPELHQQAQFEVSDIRERAKQPFDKPTILFLKHVLGYLQPDDRKAVAENLYRNLPKGSMVVIGQDEAKGPLSGGLHALGFRTLTLPNLPQLTGTYWIKP